MTWNGLNRRGFLAAGAAGLGVLGATAGWVWLGTDDAIYRTVSSGAVPRILTIRELAVLEALADTIITPASGTPTALQAQTARRVDLELSFHRESQLASDVRTSLELLEFLPALGLRGPRFTALSPADRAAFLASCAASSWSACKLAYTGIRFLVLFFYYTDDRTWHSIGYAGPAIPEKIFAGGNRIANLPPIASRNAKGA